MTKQRIKVTQETLDYIRAKEQLLYDLVEHDINFFGNCHETTEDTRTRWATIYDLLHDLEQEEII